MARPQSSQMQKAEKQFKELLDAGFTPNIGMIARKYGLSVAAFYQAKWYKELKSLGKL